jgi:polyketide cyclase/dehydrase/lipid transport protein
VHQLQPVHPDFVDHAPKRYVFEALVAASPAAVWEEISAPPSSWPQWFPSVSKGGFEGDPPYGVGTRRWVRASLTDFRETVVEWDAPRRFAYRIDETSRPLAHAMVERWTIEPDDDGRRAMVRWTMALEPRLMFRLLVPAPGITMRPVFRRAMRNLERRLSRA